MSRPIFDVKELNLKANHNCRSIRPWSQLDVKELNLKANHNQILSAVTRHIDVKELNLKANHNYRDQGWILTPI